MDFKLKSISPEGIEAALSKAEVYRFLNEPEEAESICQDVLATQPGHQLALRVLGLAVTDQFTGDASDRYSDAENAFQQLTDAYERLYYTGLLHERRAKAQLPLGLLFFQSKHRFTCLHDQDLGILDAVSFQRLRIFHELLHIDDCVTLLAVIVAAQPNRDVLRSGNLVTGELLTCDL